MICSRWFFFGWLIVLVSFTSSMINAGTGSYALGFFIVPMGDELGISRLQFSFIPLFKLLTIPILPLLGVLVDKKNGARILVAVGSLIGGIALAATSLVENIWQFYITYGVLYGLGTAAMGSQLVGTSLISKWFVQKRGRAMAIGTMGISAGGVIIAPIAGLTISAMDWRSGWLALSIVTIVAIVPPAILFIRRAPEDIDLLPDGGTLATEEHHISYEPEVISWPLIQSLKSRTFWIFSLIQALGICGLVPVLFHEIAYIQDKGFQTEYATIGAWTLALSALISKLPFGFLSERMDVRKVLALCLIPAGISTFLIIPATSLFTLLLWGIIHGFFMGGFPTIMGVALPTYFGRQHMGSIRGVISPIIIVVSSFSPLLGGILWNDDSSYKSAFVLFGTTWIIGGLLPLALGKPKPPDIQNSDIRIGL